jgi:hypothetical protein
MVLITDKTKSQSNWILTIYIKVNVGDLVYLNFFFTIIKTVLTEKPDAVLFNLQFVKFGDKKIPAAMGLLICF